MSGSYDKLNVRKLHSYCRPIQYMHTCLIISVNIYQWLLENERKHVQLGSIDIDLDLIRDTTRTAKFRSMVGTYDKIKVRKLYSHCRPIQFMHTCLIISLHGVVVFVVIIERADKYMCRCNNGENSKLPNARGTTVRYDGCVVSVVL